MILNKIIALLKGGEGSGNFDHSGRPGEVGGSAKEGSAAGEGEVKEFTRDLIARKINRIPVDRRALDKDYFNSVKKFSKLDVSFDENVADTTKLTIYEQFSMLPDRVRENLDNSGTWIRVISERDSADDIPTTMEGKFYKYGEADFANNTITIYEYKDDTSDSGSDRIGKTTSHESGHMVVYGIAGEIAAMNIDYKSRNDLLDKVDTYSGSKNSAVFKELKQKLSEADDKLKSYPADWGMLWHDFENASREEGGVTNYSNSYRGGGEEFRWEWKNDAGKFGKVRMKLFPQENFSEFFSRLHGGLNMGGEKSSAYALKRDKPESFKAFMKLYTAVKKHGVGVRRLWPD